MRPAPVAPQSPAGRAEQRWTCWTADGPTSGICSSTAPTQIPSCPTSTWSTNCSRTRSARPSTRLATSYVQAALVNGTTYYYIVTAVNSVGEGAARQVSAAPAAPDRTTRRTRRPVRHAGDARSPCPGTRSPAPPATTSTGPPPAGVTTANGTQIPGRQPVHAEAADQRHHLLLHRHRRQRRGRERRRHRRSPPRRPHPTPPGRTRRPLRHAGRRPGHLVLGRRSPAPPATTSTGPPPAGVTTANGTQITGATSPYTQAALVNGTTYYYIVTAVNAAGESAAVTPRSPPHRDRPDRHRRPHPAACPPRQATTRSPCPGPRSPAPPATTSTGPPPAESPPPTAPDNRSMESRMEADIGGQDRRGSERRTGILQPGRLSSRCSVPAIRSRCRTAPAWMNCAPTCSS